MAIRNNRNYNNPALGAAFDNLAAAFAPPSGADLAGYASANAKNAEASRLAEYYANAGNPDFDRRVFDRQGIALGQFTPVQSFEALDANNATARYGVDVGASTLRANNAADNDRALIATIMQTAAAPVSKDAIRPGFNPSDYGVSGVPAVPEFAGRVSPLSETEWKAGQNQRLLDNGAMTDQMLVDTIVGDKTPVQAVGSDGKPTFMSPGAAVREGAEPFVKATGATETQNYRAPNGSSGTAYFDSATNSWRDTATQTKIPQGSITFNSSLQGGAAETGLAPTVANTTKSNDLEATLNAVDADTDALIALLQKNAGVAGVPGDVRGVLQNAGSVLSEVSAAFGGLAPDAKITVDNVNAAINSITPGRDPAIQQYKTGIANLAYRMAQMNNPGGEVSRQAYERALESLQGGMLANNQSALEALGALKEQTARLRATQLDTLRNPGQTGVAASNSSDTTFATNPTTGERLQLVNGQWIPVK